ncbi:TSC22 domain family protein 1-like [Nerophis lumbriciformis]|uniref:TSC22 domain family protein 1-like n=1 Tax=Nerophis lumbriciformis TaxID=546530 RepID=UPI002ADF8EB4|nr:TSC22 domain family protein 1-like [Nerophis lumbriciformis]
MHHPDPTGDSGGVRKMVFHRRGSNTGGGSGSTLSTPAVANSHGSAAEEYQTSLLIQCQTPAGSSSPGPHHPPSHSLNLHSQATQSTGAQMKKKSGFQITSVTSAQISVSTNNSIAEDTESYDDLDESHTEDLSSSEIMDVSLSRANDVVGAERSSSEETLNNFHEAETPGLLSPNQPSLNQAPQHGGGMVNGTVHRHPPQNHGQAYPLSSGPVSTSSTLASVTQKMPSNVSQEISANMVSQPVGVVGLGPAPAMLSSATGAAVSIVNPQTSSVSNVNMLSSANVPVRGGISASANSNAKGTAGAGDGSASGGNLKTNANNSMNQLQQNLNSHITFSATNTSVVTVASASGGPGLSCGIQTRHGSAVLQSMSTPVTVAAIPAQPAPTPAPAVATTSSRFRVVKLDSSSEPFKKGRWICTEFYDKDTPNSATCSSTSDASSGGMRQFVSENFVGCSERESTSSSSVSSTLSTVSHYMENVGSGEAGGPSVAQHAQDYASPSQGFQAIIPCGLSMGVSHTQPHMNPQDIAHSHINASMASSNNNQPVPMPCHPITSGMPLPHLPQQQLTYAQAVANQPTGSTQGLVSVQPHQLGYAPLTQPPCAASVQMRPPEYSQPHQALLNQGVPSSSGQPNGGCQVMGGLQQSQTLLQSQPQQPSSLQATTSNASFHVGVAGQPPPSHSSHLDCLQQKPQSLPTQIQSLGVCAQLPTTIQNQVSAAGVPPSNPPIDHQAQVLNVGNNRMHSQGVPQSVSHDLSSAQALALAHAAQASALYASLPTFTTTELQDAQRLLLQYPSALLGLPKCSGGDPGSGSSTGQNQEAGGNAAIASALTASAGLKTLDGEEDGSSGASVVAIDNKIEQAMDLVKSHLMYAVREEVEVLKEQIKELIDRNSQLEQENTLLKTLASPEQMAQFQAQVQTTAAAATTTPPSAAPTAPASALAPPGSHTSGPSA